ncbi:unnamed protein product, partial [marine sediment metagenome]
MDYNIITEQYLILNKPPGKRFPNRRIGLSTYMGKGELTDEINFSMWKKASWTLV